MCHIRGYSNKAGKDSQEEIMPLIVLYDFIGFMYRITSIRCIFVLTGLMFWSTRKLYSYILWRLWDTVCQMEKHLEVWKNLAHQLLKARSAWKMDEIRSQGKAACVPRNKKKHVMISFNDSPAKWRASFQGMSYSHKSSLPGWWEIPCKWSDRDPIFHPFCT